MTMKKTVLCALVGMVTIMGSLSQSDTHKPPPRPVVIALYTEDPIVVDGKLDEQVWQNAPAYPLYLSADKDPEGLNPVQENGEARLAWDDDHLYIAMDFVDTDVVAEGKHDNEMHINLGDVGEVFIKPDTNTVYWELYVTPRGKKSTFFLPSWARFLPSCFDYEMEMTVAASVQGTLNDWTDRDQGWTAEMAIPRTELERYGDTFPDSGWTILVSRYNYGRYLNQQGPELTMMPRLPKTNFHYIPGYAQIDFQRP